MNKLLEKIKRDFEDLPPPPSSAPLGEVLQLISDFTREVERQGDGIPGCDSLLHQVKQPQDEFRIAIRRTAPFFVPRFRDKLALARPAIDLKYARPAFLLGEEDSDEMRLNDGKEIFIDDVLETAEWCVPLLCRVKPTYSKLSDHCRAVTRELPNNYPFIVQTGYIKAIVGKWNEPAHTLFKTIAEKVKEATLRVVETHFGNYTHSRFKQRVS